MSISPHRRTPYSIHAEPELCHSVISDCLTAHLSLLFPLLLSRLDFKARLCYSGMRVLPRHWRQMHSEGADSRTQAD